jgi:hypothetical protein
MDGFLQGLGQNFGYLAIGGTFAISFIAMAAARVFAARARERSRRELAAYVAEGSMTADEAERILSAGTDAGGHAACCGSRTVRRKSSTAPAPEPDHLSV